MSLQVWLPLTGHLNNQGLSNVTVTNNDATIDNNGKIGKCYSFNGSSNYIKETGYTNFGPTFSIACWFYVTVNNQNHTLVCTRTAQGAGVVLFLMNGGKLRIDAAIVADASVQWTTNYTYPVNTWQHLVVTRSENTVSYYVNGELKETKTITYNSQYYGNTVSIGASQHNNASYANYLKGKLNDVRIYDHALSEKEVKELSKGLVLHYPLSAGFGGAENLFRDSAMGQHAIDNLVDPFSTDWTKYFRYYNGTIDNHSFSDGIDTITLQSGTNIGIAFQRKATDIALDSSSYYTISCEAKCEVSGAHLDIGLSYYNTSNAWVWRGGTNPQNFTAVDAWQKFTITFKPDANTQYIMYCFTVNSTTGKHFSIKHCKLEKGSVATPWTMNMLDTEMADLVTTEYDTSGLLYNGVTTGAALTYNSDTSRYNVCSHFVGTNYIYLTSPSAEAVSISLWVKWDSIPSGQSVVFMDYKSRIGFGLMSTGILCGSVSGSYYTFSKANIQANKWYHFVIVSPNGATNTTRKLYINGVEQTATSNTSQWTYTIDQLQIGKRSTTSDGFVGCISDFRMYATVLTTEDIVELYNTAASLANNGTLFAYDFVEV